MLGYSLSEVVGKSVLDFTAPEYRQLVAEKMRSGSDEPYEGKALRKDGTQVHVELVGKAHVYRGRQVRVVALRDVTERKRAEETLRRADRLASLGTMVAGVAHELNNPLMAVSGLSQLLATTPPVPQNAGTSLRKSSIRSLAAAGSSRIYSVSLACAPCGTLLSRSSS